MKILLTGSNGFIGKNLSEYLKSNYENVDDPKRTKLLLTDFSQVTEYLSKNKFDVVIHCGVTLFSIQQNLDMYFNLEKNSDKFGKMICIGSGAEYDPKNYHPMMNETYFGKNIPSKDDIYSFSKYQIAKDIELKNKNIYNLRVFGIYGKYEDYNRRFISNNICRVLSGNGIIVNQNSIFDYLYINDLCNLLNKFLKSNPQRKSYNLCTSQPIELIKLAEIIKKISNFEGEVIIKNKNVKMNYTGDNSVFLSEFGNYKFIDHSIAIEELYQWYRNKSNINFKEIKF